MNDPRILLNDPQTTAAQLAEIAGAHPEFAALIGAHPNAYPALRDWARQTAASVPQQGAAPAQSAPQRPPMPAMPSAPQNAASNAQNAAPERPAAPAGPSNTSQNAPTQAYGSAQQFQNAPTQPQQPYGQPNQVQPNYGQQPQQGYGQQPQPGYGQPNNYGQPGAYPGQAGAPEKKKNKNLIVGIAAGAAVVLVGGGIGAYALMNPGGGGGANDPAAAVQNLFTSAKKADVLGTMSTIAPSEAGLFADAMTELTKLKGEGDGRSYDEIMKDLQDAMKVEIADVETEDTKLADDVTRVTLTDWSVTIDGDPEKVADLMTELMSATTREQMLTYGYSETEIEEMLADQRAQMVEEMDFPQTMTAEQYRDETGSDLTVVTVEEDGQWYVSVLMTAADTAYLQMEAEGSVDGTLGDKVLDPTKFDTPEAAATGLTEAIASGDLTQLTQALALPERRLLSIYGPAFGAEMTPPQSDVPDPLSFSSEEVDGKGRITIEEMGIDGFGLIEGICFTPERDGDKACLDDVPVLEKLGIADIDVIALKENGGWLVSPLATVGDIAAILAKNFVPYYNEGRMDELTEGM